MCLHRIIAADTPLKFRTNRMNAIGFRDCGILAFLSCNPEAIIASAMNFEGGTMIVGRSIRWLNREFREVTE